MIFFAALFPWVLGFIGLGIGLLIVGSNSPWLLAFAFIAVAIGYLAVLGSI